MKPVPPPCCSHALPGVSRRTAIQAGAIGLLGMGINHLAALRALAAVEGKGKVPVR